MSVIAAVTAISIFLIGLCALEHYTRNSILPYVCWVLLAGVGYGLLLSGPLPQLPPLQSMMSPDVVLYIFLPLLIFDSSRKLDLKTSQEVALPSFLLASFGIVVNMFVMGGITYGISRFFHITIGWLDILLLCGIMSATDPVAVGTVFQVFHIPKKLRMLIEGESLLNDGTTVIVFMLLSGVVLNGKEFHLVASVGFFSIAVAGAAAIGVVFGLVGSVLLRSWQAFSDHFIAPLLPILFIYLAFATAQAGFDISGVIAVMAATITFRVVFNNLRRDESPSENEKERYVSLWDFLAVMANVLLFFVLGVEMGMRMKLGGLPHWVVPAGITALIIARVVVIYGFGLLIRPTRMRVELPWLHVMNIGGLRGALSVALVLMIPLDYYYRDVFLYVALSMCLFTLIVNPLVMRIYLKNADLGSNA